MSRPFFIIDSLSTVGFGGGGPMKRSGCYWACRVLPDWEARGLGGFGGPSLVVYVKGDGPGGHAATVSAVHGARRKRGPPLELGRKSVPAAGSLLKTGAVARPVRAWTRREKIRKEEPRKKEGGIERDLAEMILVAIVAELFEEYTVLLARVLEQLFHEAPFPRRMSSRVWSQLLKPSRFQTLALIARRQGAQVKSFSTTPYLSTPETSRRKRKAAAGCGGDPISLNWYKQLPLGPLPLLMGVSLLQSSTEETSKGPKGHSLPLPSRPQKRPKKGAVPVQLPTQGSLPPGTNRLAQLARV
ncbi:hypothetical protein H6P81_008329 [Aristolochia fimbriata]|uniref:Uncharacterized protein n=1 Tax=Aristolochia fimbriata TaxID=158543 RepID=A0AAV7F526_ARIFI|nr:hypothetical protein H6P81_008329 [Aristolochia fimbriata]